MSASGPTPGSSARPPEPPPATPVGGGASDARGRSRWMLAGIVLLVVAVAAATVAVGVAVRNEGDPANRAGPVRVVALEPPPTPEERKLFDHIPFAQEVSGSKVTWDAAADCRRGPIDRHVVASFECTLTGFGAEGVRYSLFANRRAMDRAYAREVDAAGVEPFTGSCEQGAPAEENWQSHYSGAVGSVLPDGRVLCFRRDRLVTYVWTSSSLQILSTASSSGGWKALHGFWSTTAGPFE
jgi:hypothetical protein